ncbi:hypothetical protein [Robiginitalea biformata]|uniref:hypothetical protein n=1 Tax=Robiginitalea biformata TaxID=252307 RepID=UPI0011D0578B|nr:hypothetical protein [Robiginitalea biformata]
MNTRKIFYTLIAFSVLFLAACSNDTGDGLYEGVNRTDITPDRSVNRTDVTPDRAVNRTDITPNRSSVNRTDITPDKRN